MRRAIVFLALLSGLLSVTAAAAGHTWAINASPKAISVGGYRIYGAGAWTPTYQQAVDRFGAPQSCVLRPFAVGQKPASNYSRVRWRSLGLQAEFITYGMISDGGDACSKPRDVQLSTLTATGTQWRTALGLRVGDTVARLQQLYPRALPHNNAFWIVTSKSVVGSVSTGPVFSVTIREGRVTSFVFSIGAQGD